MKNFLSFFMFITTLSLSAQGNSQWINYTNTNHVTDMVERKNIRWIATTGGVIKMDLRTGRQEIFNRGNSDIPSNYVIDIALDIDNVLWVATRDGLASFNGKKWVTHFEEANWLIPYNLTINKAGYLITTIGNGLAVWDGNHFIEITGTAETVNLWPSSIAYNPRDEGVWVSYYTYGYYTVCHYRDTAWTCYDYESYPDLFPMESPDKNPVSIDSEGNVWAGNWKGVFRQNETEIWENLTEQFPGLPNRNVQSIVFGANDHMWVTVTSNVGTNEGVIFEMAGLKIIDSIPFPNRVELPYRQHFIKVNENNDLFFGSSQEGLWQYQDQEWQRIALDFSPLSSNAITQVFTANDEVWIKNYLHFYPTHPTNIFPMTVIQNGEWQNIDHSAVPNFSPENRNISLVNQQGPDSLWFLVNNRLWLNVNDQWIDPQLPDVSAEIDEYRSVIHWGADGMRWLMDVWSAYILHETPNGWEVFHRSEHGNTNGIPMAYFNHPTTNNFWLGSYSGISIYDDNIWTILKPAEQEGISFNNIVDMTVTTSGDVWAITRNQLLKIDPQLNFSIVRTLDNYQNFRQLAIDQNGVIWLGMEGKLLRYDQDNWTTFDNTNSGIPNSSIKQLHFDRQDNLWIGTDGGGLAVYNPEGLADHFFLNNQNEILLEITDKTTEVTVFPNPHRPGHPPCGALPDDFPLGSNTFWTWYNSLGQLVSQFAITDYLALIPHSSYKNWPGGVYYLNIQTGKASKTVKVVMSGGNR